MKICPRYKNQIEYCVLPFVEKTKHCLWYSQTYKLQTWASEIFQMSLELESLMESVVHSRYIKWLNSGCIWNSTQMYFMSRKWVFVVRFYATWHVTLSPLLPYLSFQSIFLSLDYYFEGTRFFSSCVWKYNIPSFLFSSKVL